MNETKLLHYLRLALHGEPHQKKEAEAYLIIAEEEARREAEQELRWAEMQEGLRRDWNNHTTSSAPFPQPSFFEVAADICKPL